MKTNKVKTVAQQQRWLYAYAAISVLSMIIGIMHVFHSQLPMPAKGPYFTPGEQHIFILQSVILNIFMDTAVIVYMLTAKKVKHVLILLYVLLAFEVLALPFLFTHFMNVKFSLLQSAVTILQACSTAAIIILMQGVKREDKNQKKTVQHRVKVVKATAVPEGPAGWRRFRKVIRILFRINTVMYGLNLFWVGALLLSLKHDRLTVLRLFIPFILMGILYVFPYYKLKSKQLAVYVGSLLLVSALTILSLQIPVHVGHAAPASLPPPPYGLINVSIWMFFRLSPAFVVYAVLICFDATSSWTKQIARIDEDKRAAVTLFWVFLFIGSLILGSIVRTHSAAPTVNNAPQQLVAFISKKYNFQIGFPGTPSVTNATEKASSGNLPVPYTIFNTHTDNDGGLNQVYDVYAYDWPDADGTLTGLSQAELKSSLEGYADNDIANNNGKLVNMKSFYLYSGQKLAVEAHYTVYQQYYGNVSEYVRVISNGQFEYDIEASGISQADFEKFADSFQIVGTIIPDTNDTRSSDTINMGDAASQSMSIGSTANMPSGQPSDGNAVNQPSGQTNNGTVSNTPTDNSSLQPSTD